MSMTADTPRRRGRAVLLVVSLCLNVALIALIMVSMGPPRRFFGPPPPVGPLSPGALMHSLPPDAQGKIHAVVVAHMPAMRAARQQARRARMRVFQVFASPGYSAQGFSTALDGVRDADAALEEQAIAMVKDTIATLTPAERQQVIAQTRARRHRPWWRRMLHI